MDEIAVVKQRLKYAAWMQMVKACRESGMTVEHWCIQNHISSKTYYYRLKKVCHLILSQGEEYPEICSLPVAQPEPAIPDNTSENVTLRLTGMSIEIPRGIDEYTIATILRAVKTAW